ncbi:hypothetical protein PRZ48_010755 [Zasmidium cellare]|uniref:Cytochrome P450 n=1 Tax=Zasmidium cellare TaxID=395010 RepID=A0ABR0E9I5_ZASCE|nr:hypothetical protein PRZ48_010755 [Zasmidium cellare]
MMTTLVILLLSPIIYYAAWLLFFDPLRHIPGPFYTRISSVWLVTQCRLHRRSKKIQELHKKYGDIVRISSNDVSINRPEAIQEIYNHQKEFAKGPWYGAFESPVKILLTTYDVDEHAEQRRNFAPAFSARALREFEPSMDQLYVVWKKRLLGLFDQNEAATVNLNEWVTFLAYDLIAEFVYGKPFGFIEKGEDFLDMITGLDRRSTTIALSGYYQPGFGRTCPGCPSTVSGARRRKIRTSTMEAYQDRVAHPDDSKRDLLSHMLVAKHKEGGPLPPEKFLPHMASMIAAGSDSTAASTLHFIDYVSRDADSQAKIHAEIDMVFPNVPSEDWIPSHHDTQKLTYTNAVLHEVLRLRPTSSMGLERCNTTKATTFGGYTIPPNTSVSIPTYSIHRHPEVYPDEEVFRPDRWLKGDTSMQHKCFSIFSHGPRNCIGQVFAWMEILKTIALVFKMFRVERRGKGESRLREGVFLKMEECFVVLERR